MSNIKQLPGLRWQPCFVSHMGCIKGCLDYLKHMAGCLVAAAMLLP